MSKTMLKRALISVGVIALLVTGALALPVTLCRTGEVRLPELLYLPPPHDAAKLARVWIDADAACGTGKHRDPDDCLALWSLASVSEIEIAGISTVFGNAPVLETDRVMRTLVHELDGGARRPDSARLPMFKGCGAPVPRCLDEGGSIDAQAALRRALQSGTLDVDLNAVLDSQAVSVVLASGIPVTLIRTPR